MKTTMRFLFSLLLLAGLATAQEITKGQVTRSIILPAPGTHGFSVDFSVISNADGADSNNFSYDDPKHAGPLTLNYVGNWLCNDGCSFTGHFTQWYTPTAFENGCIIESGDLDGEFDWNGKLAKHQKGFYMQLLCDSGGAYRYAGGDVTINLVP